MFANRVYTAQDRSGYVSFDEPTKFYAKDDCVVLDDRLDKGE